MKPSRKPVPKEHAVRDLLAGPCGLDAGSAARQPPVAAVAEGRSLRVTECFTLFASEPAGRAAEPPQERDDSRETENRPGGGGPSHMFWGAGRRGGRGCRGRGGSGTGRPQFWGREQLPEPGPDPGGRPGAGTLPTARGFPVRRLSQDGNPLLPHGTHSH